MNDRLDTLQARSGVDLGIRDEVGPLVPKKGHYKKSQRGYISPIGADFPTQLNSTKIRTWLGVTDVMNHIEFGNDRSKVYKVTEGRILACSIGMACRL